MPAPPSNSGWASKAMRPRLGRRTPGPRLQRQALAGARGPVDDGAARLRRELHVELEAAAAAGDALAQVDVEAHAALREGASRPADSSTTMQVTEVIMTSRLAVASCPACTAS